MTEQPARTPYCHKIRYGITGAPTLTEDEMDGSHAPGVGVKPTLIELVYSPARDGKPATVSASVTGDWTRFGQPDGGQVTTHFENGPDGWPAWLAAEARLHDPEPAAVPPPADRGAAAEPVCKFEEGCHQVVACDPGCGTPCPAVNRAALPTSDEAHRLALSEALGLGTGAPWDAIYDRATELGLPPLDEDPVAQRLGLVPAPADRAAVLREAADFVEAMNEGCGQRKPCHCCDTRTDVADELRRLADEARQPEQAQPDIQVWPLQRVLTEVRCGSADWPWGDEWADLDRRHADTGYLDRLEQEIRKSGITMPVLIGSDGRLWDGHHRLRIAVRLGIGYVPVEIVRPATGEQDAPPREPHPTQADMDAALTILNRVNGQDTEATETVHGCPPDGSGLTPCCGRTPFELPLGDRISSEATVTCKGADRG